MSCLTLTHTLLPIPLAFTYIYFTLLLSNLLWVSILLLSIFLLLFILYGLAAYSLFNHQPGYQSYESTRDGRGSGLGLSVDRIGEYKENQGKIGELLLLMREDIGFDQLEALRNEYLQRYQQPTFCNTCQLIKTPRTVHCKACDKCILRRQKHSELIGTCIGARNMKIFIQYLFIAMILSVFMVGSLLGVAVVGSEKVEVLGVGELVGFAVFQAVGGTAMLLFAKEFFISYFNARDNITETERKLDIITKKNNPFKNQKYYDKLFRSNIDLLKIDEIADPNNWLQFNQQAETEPQPLN